VDALGVIRKVAQRDDHLKRINRCCIRQDEVIRAKQPSESQALDRFHQLLPRWPRQPTQA
jgi:hypothetical protein